MPLHQSSVPAKRKSIQCKTALSSSVGFRHTQNDGLCNTLLASASSYPCTAPQAGLHPPQDLFAKSPSARVNNRNPTYRVQMQHQSLAAV